MTWRLIINLPNPCVRNGRAARGYVGLRPELSDPPTAALYLAGLGLAMPQGFAGAISPFQDRAGASAAALGAVVGPQDG
jgi:hypothetical protein